MQGLCLEAGMGQDWHCLFSEALCQRGQNPGTPCTTPAQSGVTLPRGWVGAPWYLVWKEGLSPCTPLGLGAGYNQVTAGSMWGSSGRGEGDWGVLV